MTKKRTRIWSFYFRDDRTGLPSISKFIRINTWKIAVGFIIFCLALIVKRDWILTDRDYSIITLVKDFLIFFIPTVEASYQFNRKNKLATPGMGRMVEQIARIENGIEEQVSLNIDEQDEIGNKKYAEL